MSRQDFPIAAFFSRIQPGHNGHVSAMMQGIQQWVKKIILWIWSADKERTQDNPFTLEERRKIADALIRVVQQDYPEVDFEVRSVMDFGDNEQRKSYVEKTFPPFDIVISWNPIIQDIRPEKRIIKPDFAIVPYRWTHIRYQIGQWDRSSLALSVSAEVIDVLRDINAVDTMRSIEKLQPASMKIATDLIILHDGKYILWKRKFAPHGWALLWGHLDAWESIKDCAIREWREELFSPDDTSAEIVLLRDKPFVVNDEPTRDPRGRVIAFVYEAEIIQGTPVGNDDIEMIAHFSPDEIRDLPVDAFAFADHRSTLMQHIDMHIKQHVRNENY
jgi:nicotinamide mononucleotide adenylyltransferase/ADP-ribose pyrophosphatase YjhB (NUDIX family)